MGGVGAQGLVAALAILGTAVVLISAMIGLTVMEGSVSKQMTHVVPIALIQFIDFASDFFVLIEFFANGMWTRFYIGVTFTLTSACVAMSFLFVKSASVFDTTDGKLSSRGKLELAIAMSLTFVNLHSAHLPLEPRTSRWRLVRICDSHACRPCSAQCCGWG